MMEKELDDLLFAAKVVVNFSDLTSFLKEVGIKHLAEAIAAFEAAQAKHPEHVMFIKADDGARTR
jgi:hypothetical protein